MVKTGAKRRGYRSDTGTEKESQRRARINVITQRIRDCVLRMDI